MKSTNVNLVRFLLVLSLSFLFLLTVSAQKDKTNSTVTRETNSTDVEALVLLINTFPSLGLVTTGDDPCLPEPFSWVSCSSDDTPRITALKLAGSLVGLTLPDFSVMDALEIIDLSGNILLVMDFPDFLANFPKLKVLNLADTTLSGTVPTSLWERSKNKTLKLTLTGLWTTLCYSDKDVCQVDTGTGTGTNEGTSTGNDGGLTTTSFTPKPAKSRKKKTTPIALGTGIPVFVIFWPIVAFLAINHRKRKAAAAAGRMNNGTSRPTMPMHGNTMSPNPLLHGVNFQDLESAAQNILPDDQGVNTDQR